MRGGATPSHYLRPPGVKEREKIKVKYKYGGIVKTKTRYSWEVEQDLVYDFVKSVRKGEIDAAKENGYNEFVWIAIVDKRTDVCCLWRDGLTTKEIEKQLKGRSKKERCNDAVTPPAHPNCRCRLAPVTDALPSKPIKDLGDFETWLKK